MNGLELPEPMTRRRVLLLGVGAAMTTILAACGASGGGAEGSGGAASAGASDPGSGGATGTTVRMVDGNAFDPEHLTVGLGERVTWENAAPSAHTVTCDPDNIFNSGNIAPGESFSHTFDVAGDYTYSCMLHLPMVGHLPVQA